MIAIALLLTALSAAVAKTCKTTNDCGSPFVCLAGSCQCPPGTFVWESAGLVRCRVCAAGCACPGGQATCQGCSGGFYSPLAGAALCQACPPGTTTDLNLNTGCDPENYNRVVCSNGRGPLGWTACRATPPPTNVGYGGQNTTFRPPTGVPVLPPEYVPANNQPGAPNIPNTVPPYYDVPPPGEPPSPMLQTSY